MAFVRESKPATPRRNRASQAFCRVPELRELARSKRPEGCHPDALLAAVLTIGVEARLASTVHTGWYRTNFRDSDIESRTGAR